MDHVEQFVQAAQTLPLPLYAVVDGGRFDDPAEVLHQAGLSAMPLYLEAADPANRAAAGHFVRLPAPEDLRAAAALAGPGVEALVIWSWQAEPMALFRHLRTLNLVDIPNEHRRSEEDSARETVLFRHWDPNVIGALLPLLDPEQQSRLLGAAAGLAFHAQAQGGTRVAPRPADLPHPPRGMLRISAAQIAELDGQRRAGSDVKIVTYLRSTAPEQASRMSEEALLAHVARCRGEAAGHGVRTERGIGQWAFLSLVSEGRFIASPGVSEWIRAPGHQPERQLDLLLASLAPASARLGRP